jgi:hypothetical protein
VSFTAKAVAGGVLLNWTTAQEMNNASFVVERSDDGVVFQPVATLAGAGTSNDNHQYAYTDYTTVTAKLYYRLKQVDSDGRTSYSPVVTIHNEGRSAGITVYPNPVRGQFRVSLPQDSQEAWLFVTDSKGLQVISQKVVNGQSVNCGSFSNGVYFLRLAVKGKEYQTRLLKQ